MQNVISTFTFTQKVTLLAWVADLQTQSAAEQLAEGAEVAEVLAGDLAQAQRASALIAGLVTGTTTDQQLLAFMAWADYPAQLECAPEMLADNPACPYLQGQMAAYPLCVQLGMFN
ncbi:MAG: hypothetical protein ACRDCY_17975 [Aeromonas veronii]